jgi:hypothetical protein
MANEDHRRWLERPLPRMMLDYAAGDIRLIAGMHARLRYNCPPDFGAICERYSRVSLELDELPAYNAPYHNNSWMPLDVIHAPVVGEDTRPCTSCGRRLCVSSYKPGRRQCARCVQTDLDIARRATR